MEIEKATAQMIDWENNLMDETANINHKAVDQDFHAFPISNQNQQKGKPISFLVQVFSNQFQRLNGGNAEKEGGERVTEQPICCTSEKTIGYAQL